MVAEGTRGTPRHTEESKMKITKRIAAAASATALTLAAVGVAIAVTPAMADPDQMKGAAAANPVTAEFKPVEQAQRKARGATVVTLSDSALAALSPLSPEAAQPGVFGLSANGLSAQAVFPVVGSPKNGVINHVGGLTLNDGERSLILRNYSINTTTGVLSASGFIDGGKLAPVAFMDVELTAPAQGCDASANLTMAAPAAQILTGLFDVPDLTGAALGTACIGLR